MSRCKGFSSYVKNISFRALYAIQVLTHRIDEIQYIIELQVKSFGMSQTQQIVARSLSGVSIEYELRKD